MGGLRNVARELAGWSGFSNSGTSKKVVGVHRKMYGVPEHLLGLANKVWRTAACIALLKVH
jgi:hypothetical protein